MGSFLKYAKLMLDINIGDIMLTGRFKNHREVVKTMGTDELGQPLINGKKLLDMRIEKKLPFEKRSKKTKEESGKSVKKFSKKADQKSMVIDGDKIQGVGMRRTLHDYLDEKGIKGVAVNDAKTGNVEVTVDAPTKDDAVRALEELKVIANNRVGEPLRYNMPKRPLPLRDAVITNEDMERFNTKSYESFLRSRKLHPEMRFSTGRLPLEDVIRETAERYRLQRGEGDVALQGLVTARALRQLLNKETQYEFMRRENLVRSKAEGYALLAKIKAMREANGRGDDTDWPSKK